MQVIDEKVSLDYFKKFESMVILFKSSRSILSKDYEKTFDSLDTNQYANNEFIKINADYNEDLMNKLGVNAVPAILIVKNSKVIERIYGSIDVDLIKELI